MSAASVNKSAQMLAKLATELHIGAIRDHALL